MLENKLNIKEFTNLVKELHKVSAKLAQTQHYPVHISNKTILDWFWDNKKEELYSITLDDRRATIHPAISEVYLQEANRIMN